MPAQSKKKKAPLPPTLLTITLQPEGTGSLVIKRGDLAYVSQFVYENLSDIVAALQKGAVGLVEVETNPPPANLSTAPTPAAPVSQPAVPEAGEAVQDEEADPEPEVQETGEAEPPSEASLAPFSADDGPTTSGQLSGITHAPERSQLSLL